MPEFKILKNVIDCMDEHGANRKLVHIDVDQKLVDEINAEHSENYSLQDLEKAADRCLAREWLQHGSLGNKYGYLEITQKGIGAIRSKIRADEIESEKGVLKKISDYIEEHKGLFIVAGFLLALATFSLRLFGDN